MELNNNDLESEYQKTFRDKVLEDKLGTRRTSESDKKEEGYTKTFRDIFLEDKFAEMKEEKGRSR